MSAELRQAYDAFPYLSYPFPQTHPDRLATAAWIFGLSPAPVERCRVLELGCAAGGNIIPLAAAYPTNEFVGVDFSEVQVAEGRADLAALRLANLTLEAMDIMDFDERFGAFDYIVAHGVFSWVPSPVQQKLLAICARHLAPAGVAYVSYNTLPGWSMRGSVRAAMRYHTEHIGDPALRVQQARALLDFLANATERDTSAYGGMLRAEAEELRTKPDYYIVHEHLEEVNEPVYFHDFVARAARHGLRYLGEATFRDMFAGDFAPHVQETLARIAPDLVKREQFMDFLRNRSFRQTLLVHDDLALERKVSPLRVTALRAASRAAPVRAAIDVTGTAPEEFRAPDGNGVTTPYPVAKAALVVLAERWPEAIAFDALRERAMQRAGVAAAAIDEATRVLASMLLASYAAGALELHSSASPFVLESGARPATGLWQAHQARRAQHVTTLRHELVKVDDITRTLLVLLDGTHTRAEVAAKVWPTLPEGRREQLIDAALPQIARQALLVA